MCTATINSSKKIYKEVTSYQPLNNQLEILVLRFTNRRDDMLSKYGKISILLRKLTAERFTELYLKERKKNQPLLGFFLFRYI